MKTMLFLLSFISLSVFAQEAAPAVSDAIPSWFAPALSFLKGLPYVGQYIVAVLGHAVAISSILTGLTAILDAVIKTLQGLGQLKWLASLQKVAEWLAVVRPYVAYLAIQNVAKK